MTETHVETFSSHRPLLFGIAWRMLGNSSDAEDILQEAFLRWQRANIAEVLSPRAFLVTIVTRLCLNYLDLARVKREQPYGTEELLERIAFTEMNPAEDSDLADALDAAFSIVLRCLSPVERAVFLLREVFDRDYCEVARIVEKSEDNCRQILRRAREKIAGQESKFEVTVEQRETVLREFLNATESGDLNRLAEVLTHEAVLVCDGENLGAIAPPPIHGLAAVAAFLSQRAARLLPELNATVIRSFGQVPMILNYRQDELANAMAFILRDGRIQTIYLITCPVRLRSLSAQSLLLKNSENWKV